MTGTRQKLTLYAKKPDFKRGLQYSVRVCLCTHFLASSFQCHVDSEPAHFQHQVGREGEGSEGRVYAVHPQQEGQEVLRGHVHHSRRNILSLSDEVINVYSC